MKIALCFWGLCRSTHLTIESIRKNIYEVLSKHSIDYDVLVHTFSIPGQNNDLYKLLEAIVEQIEDQATVDQTLALPSFRTRGDPWPGRGPPFEALDNHIRALYSLYKVTQMYKSGGYDYIMYLRPDVTFLTPIDPKWLSPSCIVTPDFGVSAACPVNDRFAIGTPDKMVVYGERYMTAHAFSLHSRLHSETFLGYTLQRNGIKHTTVRFRFRRIRANGELVDSKLDA